MQPSFLRSPCLSFLAAILIIIVAGCAGLGSSGNSPSNPGTPGSSNPGTSNPGTSNPAGSSTFVYFGNNTFGNASSTFPFKFNADGTLTPSSPFTDPPFINGQSGKFRVGENPTFHLAVYSIDPKTGVPQAAVSTANTTGFGLVNGSTVFQGNNGINVYSVSSGGQLSLVPGSPFDAITGTFFEKQYLGLQIVGSLLFGEFNTVKDAGNITVFSIAPNGALTRKGEVGSGETPPSWAVHPNARFVYEVCCSVGVNVFSFDPDTGSSTLVQQVSDPSEGEISLDPSAKFLLMHDNGIRVFSIDQGSGKLTEVAGSPFVTGDTSVLATKFAPGGHFLLVKRRN